MTRPALAHAADEPADRLDPHRLHDRLVARGLEWADREAAAQLMEEGRKSVLAEVTLNHLEDPRGSWIAAEGKARADPLYTLHVRDQVEARRLANRARVNYDAAKVFVSLLQSRNATRREEIKHLGIVP